MQTALGDKSLRILLGSPRVLLQLLVDRPSSTLANARHAKHLEFNLHNLN